MRAKEEEINRQFNSPAVSLLTFASFLPPYLPSLSLHPWYISWPFRQKQRMRELTKAKRKLLCCWTKFNLRRPNDLVSLRRKQRSKKTLNKKTLSQTRVKYIWDCDLYVCRRRLPTLPMLPAKQLVCFWFSIYRLKLALRYFLLPGVRATGWLA